MSALLATQLHPAPAQAASIRVAPFDAPAGDKAAATFAQGFAADLAQIATSGGAKLKVFDSSAPAASHAEYTLNGSVRSDTTNVSAALTLTSSADGAIIWSTKLSRPVAEADAMHHQAEVRMGSVFVCALDHTARNRNIVSLDALKTYLQACEAMPSYDDLTTRKLWRDLVQLAPRFAEGWAMLAQWNGFAFQSGEDDTAKQQALDAADRALALDPKNASAWVARGMVKPTFAEWEAAQADYSKALSLDPDEPIGAWSYARNLWAVGRVHEALDYAKRAAVSGPQFCRRLRWSSGFWLTMAMWLTRRRRSQPHGLHGRTIQRSSVLEDS